MVLLEGEWFAAIRIRSQVMLLTCALPCLIRGFVVSVVRDLDLPVKLVGVGEALDDLRDFEPEVSYLCIDR